MDVRGVTGEQHPSAAVGDGLAGHVGEARDESWAVRAVVRAVDAYERGSQIVEGRFGESVVGDPVLRG